METMGDRDHGRWGLQEVGTVKDGDHGRWYEHGRCLGTTMRWSEQDRADVVELCCLQLSCVTFP